MLWNASSRTDLKNSFSFQQILNDIPISFNIKEKFVTLSSNGNVLHALTNLGRLYAWGESTKGILGLGT